MDNEKKYTPTVSSEWGAKKRTTTFLLSYVSTFNADCIVRDPNGRPLQIKAIIHNGLSKVATPFATSIENICKSVGITKSQAYRAIRCLRDDGLLDFVAIANGNNPATYVVKSVAPIEACEHGGKCEINGCLLIAMCKTGCARILQEGGRS